MLLVLDKVLRARVRLGLAGPLKIVDLLGPLRTWDRATDITFVLADISVFVAVISFPVHYIHSCDVHAACSGAVCGGVRGSPVSCGGRVRARHRRLQTTVCNLSTLI